MENPVELSSVESLAYNLCLGYGNCVKLTLFLQLLVLLSSFKYKDDSCLIFLSLMAEILVLHYLFCLESKCVSLSTVSKDRTVQRQLEKKSMQEPYSSFSIRPALRAVATVTSDL